MEIEKLKYQEMQAYEAFIRRASLINLPFMLKGSYVTRQYFKDRSKRMPADLDWVYLDNIKDEENARKILNEWATLITELDIHDNVKFRSFSENEFWRRIDYAMADDFPTVNTDLECWVQGERFRFSLDVSFNLDIEQPPVGMVYQPVSGEPFSITHTVPLCLQVSWKIHQTLVRPRFKDLFDLINLVQHPGFDKTALANTMQALVNECAADNVDEIKLKQFLHFDMAALFPNHSIEIAWAQWRHNKSWNTGGSIMYFEKASSITDPSELPADLPGFLDELTRHLANAGLDKHLLDNLPSATRQKRRSYSQTAPIFSVPVEKEKEDLPVHEPPKKQTGLFSFIKKIFK